MSMTILYIHLVKPACAITNILSISVTTVMYTLDVTKVRVRAYHAVFGNVTEMCTEFPNDHFGNSKVYIRKNMHYTHISLQF